MPTLTTDTGSQAPALLQLKGLHKRFGGVHAVDGVELKLERGEILGLVGENGAGKSTVVRMLSGLFSPDAGQILLDGEAVDFGGARDARSAGVTVIHQELSLIDGFSVAENLFFGEPYPRRGGVIDWARLYDEARRAFARFGHKIDVERRIGEVAVWERWLTEVVRGLRGRSRVLVLDEPTAAMDLEDVNKLFAALRHAAAAGSAIIFVSHRIGELLDICDRVHVMRDGRSIADRPVKDLDADVLVRLISGDVASGAAHAAGRRPTAAPNGGGGRAPALLRADGITAGRQLRGASLAVRAGEILGVAGLVGSGRSTLLRVLGGAQQMVGGQLFYKGRPVRFRGPKEAASRGIVLLAEDRLAEGLITGIDLSANVTLGYARPPASKYGMIMHRAERRVGAGWIERLRIAGAQPAGPVLTLSGGNQQKVLFARALERRPKVLVLDEPTRGVDVGARAELHELIRSFAREGGAVVFTSSDFDELCDVADRAVVLREGQIVGELTGSQLQRDRILRYCYEHN